MADQVISTGDKIAAVLRTVALLAAVALSSLPAFADSQFPTVVSCAGASTRITLPGFELACSVATAGETRRYYETMNKKSSDLRFMPYYEATFPRDADTLRINFKRKRDEWYAIGDMTLATATSSRGLGDLDPEQAIGAFVAFSEAIWGKEDLFWYEPVKVQGYQVVRFTWVQAAGSAEAPLKACFTFVRYGATVEGGGHHTRSFGKYCETATSKPAPPVSDQTISEILRALPKAD